MKYSILIDGLSDPLVLDVNEISYSRNAEGDEGLGSIGVLQKGEREMVYIEIEKVDYIFRHEEEEEVEMKVMGM